MLNIVTFVKNLLPSISKDSLTQQLSNSEETLVSLSPVVENYIAHFKENSAKSEDTERMAKSFLKHYKGNIPVNAKKTKDLNFKVLYVIGYAIVILINAIKIMNVVSNKVVPSKILKDGTGVRNIALLKMSEYVSFSVSSIVDYLDYIGTMEARFNTGDSSIGSSTLTTAKEKDFLFTCINMSKIFTFFSLHDKGLSKSIDTLPADIMVNTGLDVTSEIAITKAVKKKSKLMSDMPSLSNFTGNPIYHVRMALADYEVESYELKKEKKAALELKLLWLKTQKDGESNAKIEKQYAYYEKKIASLEYKINRIEEEGED